MGYKFAQFIVRLLVRSTTCLEVQGLENVPQEGSFVVASNHLGRLDPALVYYLLDRQDIILLVAEKYGRIGILRWFGSHVDAIFVDRFGADFGAVREALSRLRKGGVLVLAPEGTRSRTAALIEGRSGASYLAAKANTPIIPVAITGTEDYYVYSQLKRLRRARVTVRVGKPFTLPAVKGKIHEEVLKGYTDQIMCQIAALLPVEYRGVYTDHPCLKELVT